MTTTLAGALAAAQAEMPAVEKDGRNPHFGNAFVSLDNLIAKTRPVLNRHGLSIVQFPTVADTAQPTLRTIILYAETGEQLAADMPLFVGAKQDMQALGSAITYARRYAWAAALGIASDEDDDGHHASTQPRETSPPKQAANGSSAVISEAQQKRLFALSKQAGIPADEVKRIVKEIAGVDHTNQIPKASYDAVCEAVENAGLPF